MRYDLDILNGTRSLTDEERAESACATSGLTEANIQLRLQQKWYGSAKAMLPNYTPIGWYESDMYIVTKAGYSIEVEIKLSVADFRADFRKTRKHERLAESSEKRVLTHRRPTRFFYAMPEYMVCLRDIPTYAGLIYMRFVNTYRPGIPQMTVVRNAPRLNTAIVPDAVIENMLIAGYYRFWRERRALVEYRDRQKENTND